MQLSVDSRFDFDSINTVLTNHGFGDHGIVQKVIDNAVIRWCMDYTPADTFMLAKSPYAASDIGSGIIVYPGPYAHYMYMGEVYGPNIPFLMTTVERLHDFSLVQAREKLPLAEQFSTKLIKTL